MAAAVSGIMVLSAEDLVLSAGGFVLHQGKRNENRPDNGGAMFSVALLFHFYFTRDARFHRCCIRLHRFP